MGKTNKISACIDSLRMVFSPQQTSRASECKRNSGGIFLTVFQVCAMIVQAFSTRFGDNLSLPKS